LQGSENGRVVTIVMSIQLMNEFQT